MATEAAVVAKPAAALATIPPLGSYFTDGQRLAEFFGVDDEGMFVMEDASSEERLTVSPAEWVSWIPVAEWGKDG